MVTKYRLSFTEMDNAYGMPYANEASFIGCNEFATAVWARATLLAADGKTDVGVVPHDKISAAAVKILNASLTQTYKDKIAQGRDLTAADIESFLKGRAENFKGTDEALKVIAAGGQNKVKQGVGMFVLANGMLEQEELHTLFHIMAAEHICEHREQVHSAPPSNLNATHLQNTHMADYWTFAPETAAAVGAVKPDNKTAGTSQAAKPAAAHPPKPITGTASRATDAPVGAVLLEAYTVAAKKAKATGGTATVTLQSVLGGVDKRITVLDTYIRKAKTDGVDAESLVKQRGTVKAQRDILATADVSALNDLFKIQQIIDGLTARGQPTSSLKAQLQSKVEATPTLPAHVIVTVQVQ
jgi:hypothetical protein